MGSAAYAVYGVSNEGTWPKSWPKELESLRNQATTYEGSEPLLLRYAIPFTNREAFEAAWPYFLKVKSKGAPIILVRKIEFFEVKPAGVLIHSPPANSTDPETPVGGDFDVRTKWMNTTFIELVVDGKVVDLNRIPLPPDTPIVDERFKDDKTK